MYFLQLSQLPNIQIVQYRRDLRITHLLTDSRKLIVNQGSVFFAIAGPRHDAHRYVYEAYEAGIRMFVVDQISKVDLAKLPEANIALASDTVAALQGIAASHRWQYQIDVLGITGSNAKTTIKEYLAQMLEGERSVVKSPKSYNSQIGVPLSVWLLNESHDLAIFEAGISTVGEMEKLEQVIRPTIGLFTNIGTAHDEGFGSQQEKVREKLKLFRNVDTLIYRADHALIDQEVQALAIPHFTWATHADAHVKVTSLGEGKLLFARGTDSFEVAYPFVDPAAMENLSHCVVLLIHMGFAPHKIASLIRRIKNVAMRLELKQGINHCYLIDDTYNNDLAGLQIALEFLDQQNMRPAKSVILSDLIQSGPHQERVYADMAALLKSHHLKKIYAIGTAVSKYRAYFPPHTTYFSSTQDFLNTFSRDELRDEIVLIKGARSFAFEKIVERLAY
ncbi:MAG TPA: Mur ligase family protein, partial [Cytophagales bacterium]|nr:Mur ligase family protein [Cytophagales bacterium]